MNLDLPLKDLTLPALLKIPKEATQLVIFAHGSGSTRLSRRNNYVADTLNQAGIATLLFDLLTQQEDFIFENRFNLQLIAERLVQVTQWAEAEPETESLLKGFFGASTGSAAAILAANQLPKIIKTIVSRGGRPDLVLKGIKNLRCPTLFIVGEEDVLGLELNKQALEELPESTEKELIVIPRATHLFEEPGALEEVAECAKQWFLQKLK